MNEQRHTAARGQRPDDRAPNPQGPPIPGAPSGGGVSGMDPMLEAKLWRNPCWLAFRLNYLALRYNVPLYDWVKRNYGLSRPEYVVVYALALADGARSRDISRSSGFPKNTLSRAIARLEGLKLIKRSRTPGQGRNQTLRLTPAGRALYEETLPAFVTQERLMLSSLSEDERATLSRLMAKMVLDSGDWPSALPDGPPGPTDMTDATDTTDARGEAPAAADTSRGKTS